MAQEFMGSKAFVKSREAREAEQDWGRAPAPAPFTRHSRPRPEFVLGVRQKTTPSEQRSMASRRERRE
jgi:hypothetical protein